MENKEPKSIMVKIFGRDYPFKATTDEDSIKEAARQVDKKMKDISREAPNLSTEDIAILAAMHLSDNLNKTSRGDSSFKYQIESRIESLIQRIDQVI